MFWNQSLGKTIFALLFVIVLWLPASVQFFHLFEDHQHFSCTETSTHFHKATSKCEIASFHLKSFHYQFTNYLDVAILVIPVSVSSTYYSLELIPFKPTSKQLRAPPIFS